MLSPVSRIHQKLSSSGLDGILISSSSHIAYLLDFNGFSKIERDAFILVTKKYVHLYTSPLYADSFRNTSEDYILHVTSANNSFSQQVHKTILDEQLKTIGFEDIDLTVAEFTKLQKDTIDFIPEDLSSLRVLKSQSEFEKIIKVCKLTDAVFEEFIMSDFKPGVTEKELSKILEILVLKRNANFSFPAIVAFGENAAIPHHHTGDTQLKNDDLILVDFGLELDGYCSDMTRTFFLGNPTPEQKNAYETVLLAQSKASEFIEMQLKNKKTVPAKEVDKVAREYILSKGFPSIPHSLGHGIGREVHEAPSLSPYSDNQLTNEMVFSIEPGIYLPGKYGIRIEDLYAIQNNTMLKLTNLTTHTINS